MPSPPSWLFGDDWASLPACLPTCLPGILSSPQSTNKRDKKKQLAALEARALGWAGFDDRAPPERTTTVLMHMFAPDDFLDNMLLTGAGGRAEGEGAGVVNTSPNYTKTNENERGTGRGVSCKRGEGGG